MKIFPSVKTLVALSLLGGSLATGAASAATCVTGSSGETPWQRMFDNLTLGGPSSVNTLTDCIDDSSDSSWAISGSGLSGLTLIIELAGNASTNSFGVYDTANMDNKVELFDGAASAGNQVVMTILADGSVITNVAVDSGVNFTGNNFGFYLDTASNGTFYSDTPLNLDTTDHMLAYRGTGDVVQLPGLAAGTWTPNEFVLAWEDVSGSRGADFDFNDFVVMVESVEPTVVPVPASIWLFSSALLGLVGVARRKKS